MQAHRAAHAVELRPLAWPALDGLRFYAAGLVFLVHLVGALLTEYFLVPEAQIRTDAASPAISLGSFLADGHHGVDIFFVISGFLMAKIAAQGRLGWVDFVKRRWWRIYPAFLASLVLTTLLACLLFDREFKVVDFLLNLVFYNSLRDHGIIAYNYVSWSLGYEFAFYLAVPLLAWLGRLIDRRIAAALVLGVALVAIPDGYVRMTGLFAGFLLGSFSEEHLRAFARRVPAWSVVALYCVLVTAKNFRPMDHSQFYFLLLPLVALGVACIVYGDGFMSRLFAHPTLRRLGTLSYSFYLYHPIVISLVLYKGLALTGAFKNPLVAVPFVAIGSFAATMLVSTLSYRLFEAPYFARRKPAPALALSVGSTP
jgi:peptidoglycan/LPS O-acetylase OafA/YrhL